MRHSGSKAHPAEQLAAMYAASSVGLAILDPDLRYVWVDDRFARLIGVSVADHIGRTVGEITPDRADSAIALAARVLAGETVKGLEMTGPDGTSMWRQNWLPIRDDAGQLTGIGVSVQDVTEERRAERAIATLNRINTALAAEHDLERLVQMVTDAGVELTGASVGAFFHNVMDDSGERLHLFTLSGGERGDFIRLGRPRGTNVLGPIFRNEVIRSGNITRDPRYGANAPFAGMPPGHPEVTSYLAVPVVSRHGQVLGGLLFGHPHADRFSQRHEDLILGLAAQAAVAIENARLLAAVQSANERLERRVEERTAERDRVWNLSRDLLVVVEPDGRFRSVNPAWTALFGRSQHDVAGRPVTDFVHPDDIAMTQAALAAAASGADVPVVENRYLAHDGSLRWISWLTSTEGGLIYGSGRDVTEARRKDEALQRTEEALRQSQKMEAIGQLTGGVAHDFNNLLTPILGGLDFLRRKLPDGDRSLRLLDGAIQSAERASTLVQRLLAFARRQPLQPDAVDLVALTRDMAALLTTTVGPQIQLVIDAPERLLPAIADRNQIEMALLNLAVNARDAMPTGGVMRVALGHTHLTEAKDPLAPGDYVCLSVSDTGHGMDPATLARAIEPFFSTKGVGRGTGLGLSMVHGLASQLGGTFRLASTPGAGTVAELWLPASLVSVATVPDATGAAPVHGAGCVLLVDDEGAVRAAAAQMLHDIGYRVVEADSADAALRLMRDGLSPDLLVSDHLMPGMTGTELARRLRADRPDLGVLIVSGYADVETLSPDLAHLPKPFREADLAAALAGPKVFAAPMREPELGVEAASSRV
ncbi:PAS domain-containing protein [Sphingomonas melonis]